MNVDLMDMTKRCFSLILRPTHLVMLLNIPTSKNRPIRMQLSVHSFILQPHRFEISLFSLFSLFSADLSSSTNNNIIQADSILYNDYHNPHKPLSTSFTNLPTSVKPFIDPCTDLSLQQPLVVCRSVRRIREEMVVHNSISLFIQMEYCGNGSLRDVLQSREEIPLKTRVNYFVQVRGWMIYLFSLLKLFGSYLVIHSY